MRPAVNLSILRSFPAFHFELVPVGTFEHDPLFSLINYRSRLATPWTNFSYYPGFQELAHHWVAKEPPNKFRLREAEERRETFYPPEATTTNRVTRKMTIP